MNNVSKFTLVTIFLLLTRSVAESAAQFVAILVIVGGVAVAALALNRIITFFTPTLSIKTTKVSTQRIIAKDNNPRNPRTTQTHFKGEHLMAIPAYARKAKGIAYPMSKEIIVNGL